MDGLTFSPGGIYYTASKHPLAGVGASTRAFILSIGKPDGAFRWVYASACVRGGGTVTLPSPAERDSESDDGRVLLVGGHLSSLAAALRSRLDEADVVVERDGALALARLETGISCVVVEHRPPEFEGVEFVRQVRQADEDVPVIVRISDASESAVLSALEAGATDVVAADTDAADVLTATRVRDALDGFRRRRADGRAAATDDDAVCLLDADLHAVETNSAAVTELARDERELLGDRVFESFVTASGTAFHAECRSVLESGDPTTVEAYAPVVGRWFVADISPRDGGVTVAFRGADDESRQRWLGRLSRAVHRLSRAESFEEVVAETESAASHLLSATDVGVYVFDGQQRALRPVNGDGPAVGPDSDSGVWDAFVSDSTLDVATLDDADGSRQAFVATLDSYGVLVAELGSEGLDESQRHLLEIVADSAAGAFSRLSHEIGSRDQARELERQTSRAERVQRTVQLLLDVDAEITGASTRTELERTVCETLAASDRFSFVWVGAVEDGARLVPRAWAGREQGYLEDVDLSLDPETTEPSVRAVRDRETAHVSNLFEEHYEGTWPQELLNRGHHSVLSVPLVHGGSLSGVLTVCTDGFATMDDVLKRVVGQVADTMAYAIDVIEHRQALVTDSVVELDVRVADTTDLLTRLASRVDSPVAFESVVNTSTGDSMLYVTVADAPREDVLAHLRESPTVSGVRYVTDDEDDDLFVLTVTGPMLVSRIAGAGAAIRELTATSEEVRLTVELPRPTNVRKFLEGLRAEYPEVELLAQRSRDRPVESRKTLLTRLTDRLTARQLEVLKTAYHNGYFAWPRSQNGEEIAELLGITQPTFNKHLRVAERNLLTMLFDGDDHEWKRT